MLLAKSMFFFEGVGQIQGSFDHTSLCPGLTSLLCSGSSQADLGEPCGVLNIKLRSGMYKGEVPYPLYYLAPIFLLRKTGNLTSKTENSLVISFLFAYFGFHRRRVNENLRLVLFIFQINSVRCSERSSTLLQVINRMTLQQGPYQHL